MSCKITRRCVYHSHGIADKLRKKALLAARTILTVRSGLRAFQQDDNHLTILYKPWHRKLPGLICSRETPQRFPVLQNSHSEGIGFLLSRLRGLDVHFMLQNIIFAALG